jgi:hypothetical protein
VSRLYVLVFIEHGNRRLHIGGITAHPTGDWTVQQARNLALDLGDRFGDFRFLIRDRGSNFTRSFDAVFQATGTTIVRTAVQAPRMNAICERLIGTLRRELLDRTLILNQAHLPTDPVGHAQAGPRSTSDLPEAWRAHHPRTTGHRNPGASGAVNRLLRPDSVRHMSVTTATQRLTAAHHETHRDKTEKAREAGYPQLTGRFRR